jgi:hypothetical protein
MPRSSSISVAANASKALAKVKELAPIALGNEPTYVGCYGILAFPHAD